MQGAMPVILLSLKWQGGGKEFPVKIGALKTLPGLARQQELKEGNLSRPEPTGLVITEIVVDGE